MTLGARRPRTGRALRAVLVLTLAGSLAACVRVPHSGPVEDVDTDTQPDSVQVFYNNPPPPQPGDAPTAIVQGFLNALTAVPVQTNAARQFLTTQGQERWRPERRVVVYGNNFKPRTVGGEVRVRLRQAFSVGPRGNWQGRLTSKQRVISLHMRQEGQEWRIARAPDALVVPQTWFSQQFQQLRVYFFDPTAQILVPEPVFVPRGTQQVSTLVSSLLRGPRPALSGVERSFIPAGLTAGLAVDVRRGVAEVTLKGSDPGPLSPRSTQRILAQLAWTLRQVPGVRSFRLSIGGRQIRLGPRSTLAVDGFASFDPNDAAASIFSYALHRGKLKSGRANRPTKVAGPFGVTRRDIGPFAVSLSGTQVAGVTDSGLLVGPVTATGTDRQVVTAPRLLRPSWDFADRLWDVSLDAAGRATVLDVTDGGPQPVVVPGVTGQQVTHFQVSRDGSRLVAVIRGATADRVVVSRIRYDARGQPQSASRARSLAWYVGGSPRVRDIGWLSPTTVAVLHLSYQGQDAAHAVSEIRPIEADGSTSPDDSPSTIVPGDVRYLATSPDSTATSFAVLPHTLYDVGNETPTSSLSYSGLHHITYVG